MQESEARKATVLEMIRQEATRKKYGLNWKGSHKKSYLSRFLPGAASPAAGTSRITLTSSTQREEG